MDLSDLKERLREIEPMLVDRPWVVLHTFEREGRRLHLAVTERLRKRARKEGVWMSKEMLATLKNGAYGFDDEKARSIAGQDGIFLIDRSYRPRNEMMKKLFDRFLDKPDSGVHAIASALEVAEVDLLPVRLVSHHLRLLGVLARRAQEDWLVLVDCDRS